jgi:hypothetical protein
MPLDPVCLCTSWSDKRTRLAESNMQRGSIAQVAVGVLGSTMIQGTAQELIYRLLVSHLDPISGSCRFPLSVGTNSNDDQL